MAACALAGCSNSVGFPGLPSAHIKPSAAQSSPDPAQQTPAAIAAFCTDFTHIGSITLSVPTTDQVFAFRQRVTSLLILAQDMQMRGPTEIEAYASALVDDLLTLTGELSQISSVRQLRTRVTQDPSFRSLLTKIEDDQIGLVAEDHDLC